MKRVFSFSAICAVLAAGCAYAQTSTTLRADIPFAFHVGKTEMPAGKYEVVKTSMGSAPVLIRSMEDPNNAMTVLTNAKLKPQAPEKGSLVFHRYGNTYFLSAIWRSGFQEGRELLASPAEREIARRPTSKVELAYVPLDR